MNDPRNPALASADPRPTRRGTGWLLRQLRDVAIILVTSVVLMELGIRAYDYVSPSFIFGSTDYNRLYRPAPFSYDYDFRINSRGFKDVEFTAEKAPGTTRVVALGDSFTYGAVPYDHTYVTLLKKALHERFGNVELLNMGIPGTGPRDYLELFATEAAPLRPDVVVVSVFLGNDFVGGTRRVRSYLYELVRYVVRLRTQARKHIYHGAGTYDDDAPVFSDEFYLQLERDRSLVFKRELGHIEPSVRTALNDLAEIKHLADRLGVRLYMVLLPDEVQVDPDLREKVLRSAGHAASDYDFGGLNRRISAFLDALGVEHLDLLPGFLAQTGQTRLYRINDSHLNIAGNRLAAEMILADMVRRPGLFGKESP